MPFTEMQYLSLTKELQEHVRHELEGENRLKYAVALTDELISILRELYVEDITVRRINELDDTFLTYVEKYKVTFKNTPFLYFSSSEVNKANLAQKQFVENCFLETHAVEGRGRMTLEEGAAIEDLLKEFNFLVPELK